MSGRRREEEREWWGEAMWPLSMRLTQDSWESLPRVGRAEGKGAAVRCRVETLVGELIISTAISSCSAIFDLERVTGG